MKLSCCSQSCFQLFIIHVWFERDVRVIISQVMLSKQFKSGEFHSILLDGARGALQFLS